MTCIKVSLFYLSIVVYNLLWISTHLDAKMTTGYLSQSNFPLNDCSFVRKCFICYGYCDKYNIMVMTGHEDIDYLLKTEYTLCNILDTIITHDCKYTKDELIKFQKDPRECSFMYMVAHETSKMPEPSETPPTPTYVKAAGLYAFVGFAVAVLLIGLCFLVMSSYKRQHTYGQNPIFLQNY